MAAVGGEEATDGSGHRREEESVKAAAVAVLAATALAGPFLLAADVDMLRVEGCTWRSAVEGVVGGRAALEAFVKGLSPLLHVPGGRSAGDGKERKGGGGIGGGGVSKSPHSRHRWLVDFLCAHIPALVMAFKLRGDTLTATIGRGLQATAAWSYDQRVTSMDLYLAQDALGGEGGISGILYQTHEYGGFGDGVRCTVQSLHNRLHHGPSLGGATASPPNDGSSSSPPVPAAVRVCSHRAVLTIVVVRRNGVLVPSSSSSIFADTFPCSPQGPTQAAANVGESEGKDETGESAAAVATDDQPEGSKSSSSSPTSNSASASAMALVEEVARLGVGEEEAARLRQQRLADDAAFASVDNRGGTYFLLRGAESAESIHHFENALFGDSGVNAFKYRENYRDGTGIGANINTTNTAADGIFYSSSSSPPRGMYSSSSSPSSSSFETAELDVCVPLLSSTVAFEDIKENSNAATVEGVLRLRLHLSRCPPPIIDGNHHHTSYLLHHQQPQPEYHLDGCGSSCAACGRTAALPSVLSGVGRMLGAAVAARRQQARRTATAAAAALREMQGVATLEYLEADVTALTVRQLTEAAHAQADEGCRLVAEDWWRLRVHSARDADAAALEALAAGLTLDLGAGWAGGLEAATPQM